MNIEGVHPFLVRLYLLQGEMASSATIQHVLVLDQRQSRTHLRALLMQDDDVVDFLHTLEELAHSPAGLKSLKTAKRDPP